MSPSEPSAVQERVPSRLRLVVDVGAVVNVKDMDDAGGFLDAIHHQPEVITGHPLGADRVCRVPSSTSQSDELDRGEFFQAFWAAFQADAALLDASLGEFHA
jgi:hypothetical protein